MDTLQLLGTATGLGFMAGIRLYATVLGLGLAIRFGVVDLDPEFASLEVLAKWPVIGAAAAGFLMEFFADKVAWVDTMWDAVHTFIRPIGAAVVASAALGDLPAGWHVATALLVGGVALTSHSAKAATRLLVNHSPEPVSNAGVSLLEDIITPAGIWAAMQYPLVAGGAVLLFLILFACVSPLVFRLIRIEVLGLAGLVRYWLGDSSERSSFSVSLEPGLSPQERAARLPQLLRGVADSVPRRFFPHLADEFQLAEPPVALRVASRGGLPRCKNSVGHLCVIGENLVFVTRRWFRVRSQAIPLAAIRSAEIKGGLLLQRLILRQGMRVYRFDLFKDGSRRGESFAHALNAVVAG